MTTDRQTPCLYYICVGLCTKGRKADHAHYCQHCNKYKPRAEEETLRICKKYNIDVVKKEGLPLYNGEDMEYVKANNEEECDILSLLYADGENIIASTTLSTEEIEDIDGCVNADNPDNVLDINITMADGTQVTINLIY